VADILNWCHIIQNPNRRALDQEFQHGMMSNILRTPHCCLCDDMVVGADFFFAICIVTSGSRTEESLSL
jgi:hypothetical protein